MGKTDYIGGINDEWYTPLNIISMVRDVLGTIDLDPASCAEANTIVKATTFYSKEEDGLSKAWKGAVYMNPPFSSKLIKAFVLKLMTSYKNGDVPEAIVVTHNCTDSGWFHTLASEAAAICLVKGRIKFWRPGIEKHAPSRGQVICYFGTDATKFCQVLTTFGLVWRRTKNDSLSIGVGKGSKVTKNINTVSG